MLRSLLLLAVTASLGCSDNGNKLPAPEFPADYTSTYTMVRPCKPSIEHGAVNVVVWASPDAIGTYQTLMGEYATGAVLIKEEYVDTDDTCAGPIHQWTVAQKLDDGSSPATLDWHWQKVSSGRSTIEDDDQTCISCHQGCTPGGEEGGGYLYTCSAPGTM